MIQSTVYIQQKHKDEIIVYVHVFHVFYGSSHQNRHHFQQKFWMAFGFGEHPCVVKPFKNPGEAKTLGLTNTRTECQTIRHPDVCWSFWRGWAILDRSGGLCVFLIKIAKRNTGPSLGSPIFCEKNEILKLVHFHSESAISKDPEFGTLQNGRKARRKSSNQYGWSWKFFLCKNYCIGKIYLVRNSPELCIKIIKTLQYLYVCPKSWRAK